MKKIILLSLILNSCAHGYVPQTTIIPETSTTPSYTLRVYETKIEMQNAYALYNVNRTPIIDRERVNAFFSYADDTIHVYAPFPERSIEHEEIHLRVKYKMIETNDPHFKR